MAVETPVARRANGQPAGLLTIGKAARRSGFTVKALRFYERRGLLPPSGRRPSGYRLYSEADLHRLEFIRQAKALGLTLEEIRELVVAARRPGGAGVRRRLLRMLEERIAQATRQIAALTGLRRELERRRRHLARPSLQARASGYCTCLRPKSPYAAASGPDCGHGRWRAAIGDGSPEQTHPRRYGAPGRRRHHGRRHRGPMAPRRPRGPLRDLHPRRQGPR